MVVDAALAMLREMPEDASRDELRARWQALQLELGWDGRDVRNRLDSDP